MYFISTGLEKVHVHVYCDVTTLTKVIWVTYDIDGYIRSLAPYSIVIPGKSLASQHTCHHIYKVWYTAVFSTYHVVPTFCTAVHSRVLLNQLMFHSILELYFIVTLFKVTVVF